MDEAMTEVTHAHLPAKKVICACQSVMLEIAISRHDILESIAERKRKRRWYLPRRSLKAAMKLLADEELEIAKQHRCQEEQTAREILALASAAADDDPNFRVFVCARDFGMLVEHYPMEDKRHG